MGQIEVRLLGPLRVRRPAGDPVDPSEWRTAPTRGLVAMLALHSDNLVSVDRLLATLWPKADRTSARARLRTAASQVRKVLGGPYIERLNDALVLRDAWVDVESFQRLAAQAQQRILAKDDATGIKCATEALGLYAGDLCSDLPYAEWLSPERAYIRGVQLDLLAESGEAALRLGAWRDAVTFARRLTSQEPSDERACRILMRGHHELSEIGQALRAYVVCGEALADELGVDPSPATRLLHGELLRSAPGLAPGDSVPRGISAFETDGADALAERGRALLGPARAVLLDFACVLEQPFTHDTLRHLLPTMTDVEVRAALDLLEDHCIVERRQGNYRLAGGVRDAAYRWLRPSMRRSLHEHIARSSAVPRPQRLRHWMAAGEPVRQSNNNDGGEQEALLFARPVGGAISISGELGALAMPDVANRISVLEALTVAAHRVQRLDTARIASDAAMELAAAEMPIHMSRLLRRRADLQLPGEDALAWALRARSTATIDEFEQLAHVELAIGRQLRKWSNFAAIAAFTDAVKLADRSYDPGLRVTSRMRIVLELVGSRQGPAAKATAAEAADIADIAGDRLLQARALMTIPTFAMWSGEAREALQPAERAWNLVVLESADVRLQARVALTLARALHELGRPDGRQVWIRAGHLAQSAGLSAAWDLCALQITLETGDLRACRDHLERSLGHHAWSALEYQWVRLLGGRLLAAQGDYTGAAALLREAALIGEHSGATLLVPEAYGRLAILAASTSVEEAEHLLGKAVAVAGPMVLARERSVLLLARAAVANALQHPEPAIGLATAAAAAADSAGLAHQQVEALLYVKHSHARAGRVKSAARVAGSLETLRSATGALVVLDQQAPDSVTA